MKTLESCQPHSTTSLDYDTVTTNATAANVNEGSRTPSPGSTDSPVLQDPSHRPNDTEIDVNLLTSSTTDIDPDPLQLTSMKKTETELTNLKKLSKNLQKFYKSQNEVIDELTSPVEQPISESEVRKKKIRIKLAIYGSLVANILLAALQLTVAIRSGSLVIFATMIDALMDLLSGGILIAVNHYAGKRDISRYPSGKNRFETVGIIVFGTLMSVVSLELIINAAKRFIDLAPSPDLDTSSIVLIVVAIFVKTCLYISCKLVPDPSVQILVQDHRNDVLLNSIGLAFGVLSHRLNLPFLDPVGAILVSVFTFSSWNITILQQCKLISGKVATPNFLKRVTYLTLIHDQRIRFIEAVRAYHSGSKVVVEVDIVLPPELALKDAHDLGESLQVKLESLEDVERAFVHCDYNFTHTPEHDNQL